ncbi:BLUF domain-containing protein [Hymenobacter psoromatis]|uniref:BLUF domain-containing protein n=1 Tax=Hymenobacter psoromatis TaxID=1484116 RepID=UPI001CBDC476|nr:BLUF domain-containing protein [Hymenobacter psoromatis]
MTVGETQEKIMKELASEAQRRRAIAWAVSLTTDTKLAPTPYELELLEHYAIGELTLDEVLYRLDSRVQHLLYRSKATGHFSPEQLTELLEQARANNARCQLTGLLCYASTGDFVQVLEGSALEVHALYKRIQQDSRHQHVQLLRDQATAERWFPDWQMAFVQADAPEFFWLVGYLEAHSNNLPLPQLPITEPHLRTLLAQFSNL